jgi:hypothetical protein
MPGYFNKTSYSPLSPSTNKVPTVQASAFKPLLNNGNLKSFYDDIVYWEIAKNNNKFYVTFMRGEYAYPNNKQESIATMEISYPHTTSGNNSTSSFSTGFNRSNAAPETFLQNIESSSVTPEVLASHNYNGFIPITELNSRRHFQSTITSSIFQENTYQYEIHDNETTTAERTVQAAYFYPFSNYQLSVLRDEPTLIVNMDKENELNDGPGDRGFVIIPQNCHEKVKNNVEYYLEKAGLIDKTTKFKNRSPRK